MKNLKENIDKHIKNNIYPFHMPGHKQNYNFFDDEQNINKILKYDLTEIPNLDNLNAPSYVLKDLNNRIAKIFGSYKSFLTVNGSTTGVIASIISCCNQDDFILAQRNSHKSLFSGLFLSKAKIEYIYPKILDNNLVGTICPADVEEAILANNKIKAVFVTSPTYEGIVADIKSISKITKKHNKILIVDEAHGAHFNLNNFFPDSAIKLGADIVIQSLHKTLPSLTQTAVVHINKDVDNLNIQKYISIIQTSSPSYIFSYTVDKLIFDIESKKLNFNEFIKNLEDFRFEFNSLVGVNKKITLLENENFEFDKSRLTFILNCDKTGTEIENILLEKFKIQLEMSSINHMVAISTVCDTKYGFDLLLHALIEIDKKLNYKKTKSEKFYFIENTKSFSNNFFHTEEKFLDDCENSICADFIVPYPPGIPFLLPDEIITKEHINILKSLLKKNINILGITNNKIEVKEDSQ